MTARLRGVTTGSITLLLATCAGLLVPSERFGSIIAPTLIAGAVGLTIVVVTFRHPRAGLALLLFWLFWLGLVRRVGEYNGLHAGRVDPMLLVGFTSAIALVAVTVHRGGFRHRTRLAGLVWLYTFVVAFSLVNPLGDPLLAPLGALYAVLPVLTFFVGRCILDDAGYRQIIHALGWGGLCAGAYGWWQLNVGQPPWDAAWAATKIAGGRYSALQLGGIRPFGMFTAASEYSLVLGVALVAVVFAPGRIMRAVRLPVIALLAYGLFYQGSRGALVFTVLALSVGLGFRLVRRPVLVVAIGALGMGALVLVVREVEPPQIVETQRDAIEARTIEGLQNPFDERYSTAGFHLEMRLNGLRESISNPIGSGMAGVSVPSASFGTATTVRGTEWDLSNVSRGAGVVGLVVFFLMAVEVIRVGVRVARRREPVLIAAFGILVLTFGGWLNAGQYFLVTLVWLTIGWLDAVDQRNSAALAEDGPAQPAATSGTNLAASASGPQSSS